jgi:hypothetical protein
MFHRLNAGAVSVRINLSELCAKKEDLRGIVNPKQERDKRTGSHTLSQPRRFPDRGQEQTAEYPSAVSLSS